MRRQPATTTDDNLLMSQNTNRYSITISNQLSVSGPACVYEELGTRNESIIVSTQRHVEEFKDRIKCRSITEFKISVYYASINCFHDTDAIIDAVYDVIKRVNGIDRIIVSSIVGLKRNIEGLKCNIIRIDCPPSSAIEFERTLIDNNHISEIEIYMPSFIEQLCPTIANKQNLRRLWIRSEIKRGEMQLLINALSERSLKTLTFDSCRIFRDHFDTLCNRVTRLNIKNLNFFEFDSNDTTQQRIDVFVNAIKTNYTLTYIHVGSWWRIDVDTPLGEITGRNRELERNRVLKALTDICITFSCLLMYPYVLLEIFDWTNPHYHMFWHVDKIKLIFGIRSSMQRCGARL